MNSIETDTVKSQPLSEKVRHWWIGEQPGKLESYLSTEAGNSRLGETFGRAVDRAIEATITSWEQGKFTMKPMTLEEFHHFIISGIRTTAAGLGVVALAEGGAFMALPIAAVGLAYPKLFYMAWDKFENTRIADFMTEKTGLEIKIQK